MLLAISPYALLVATPLVLGVDPVLVGIIVVMLLLVFAFFLFLRKILLSFSEGMRKGRR